MAPRRKAGGREDGRHARQGARGGNLRARPGGSGAGWEVEERAGELGHGHPQGWPHSRIHQYSCHSGRGTGGRSEARREEGSCRRPQRCARRRAAICVSSGRVRVTARASRWRGSGSWPVPCPKRSATTSNQKRRRLAARNQKRREPGTAALDLRRLGRKKGRGPSNPDARSREGLWVAIWSRASTSQTARVAHDQGRPWMPLRIQRTLSAIWRNGRQTWP